LSIKNENRDSLLLSGLNFDVPQTKQYIYNKMSKELIIILLR